MNIINEAIKEYNNGNYSNSISLYKRALDMTIDKKSLSKIYFNIALSYYSLTDFKNSKINFVKSLELGNFCKWEMCLVNFHLKNIEEGLKYWPFRYIKEDTKLFPNLPLPKYYNLADIKNKNILVLNEQGFGDEFLFSKTIPILSKNCNFIKYQLYEETINVIKKLYNYDNVEFFTDRSFNLDFIRQFDGFILSGDLLYCLFDNRENDLNVVDDDKIEYDYGFCWSPNKNSKNYNDRIINHNLFKKLNLKGISLQINDTLDFIDSSTINNFLDTYNLIKKCKVVISVDTSVVHLAGLMNKKTYLIYNKHLDWRWNYNFYKNIEYINNININELKNKIIKL